MKAWTAALTLAALGTLVDAAGQRAQLTRRDPALEAARVYGLADLCLSTEASYLRHRGQADDFAPFGLLPGAPDLAPGGTLLPPLGAGPISEPGSPSAPAP